MLNRLSRLWDRLNSGLWFLPAVMVTAATLLATTLLYVDGHYSDFIAAWLPLIFGGEAQAARTLLSTVAGALITVVSLVFSVTHVAIAQVSSQFTPRVLRNFMRDRVNQLVLGAFVSAFIYCLLILRQISDPEEGRSFVPSLSITVGIVGSLGCIIALVYFFHHISEKLQVATIMREINDEFVSRLPHQYPAEIGTPEAAAEANEQSLLSGPAAAVPARRGGFVASIDDDEIERLLATRAATVHLPVRIGDFVARGQTVAWIRPPGQSNPEVCERLASAFTIESDRTPNQDLLFLVRQLSDIALRALSPGVLDPTTAEQALGHLGDLIGQLLPRRFPPRWRAFGESHVCAERPGFTEFVHEAFTQIRRAADDSPHVLLRLLQILASLVGRAEMPERAAVLRAEFALALAQIDKLELAGWERAAVATEVGRLQQ